MCGKIKTQSNENRRWKENVALSVAVLAGLTLHLGCGCSTGETQSLECPSQNVLTPTHRERTCAGCSQWEFGNVVLGVFGMVPSASGFLEQNPKVFRYGTIHT
jgi:hypothetical protein